MSSQDIPWLAPCGGLGRVYLRKLKWGVFWEVAPDPAATSRGAFPVVNGAVDPAGEAVSTPELLPLPLSSLGILFHQLKYSVESPSRETRK